MNRTPVDSSAIKSLGHDPTTNTLEVEYRSGYVYQLGGISAEQFKGLLAADSVGKEMNALKAKAESTTRVDDSKKTDDATTGSVAG